MTRKHFTMIADAIRDAHNERTAGFITPAEQAAASTAIGMAATYIADGLVQDNPRFDRARFMAACGF